MNLRLTARQDAWRLACLAAGLLAASAWAQEPLLQTAAAVVAPVQFEAPAAPDLPAPPPAAETRPAAHAEPAPAATIGGIWRGKLGAHSVLACFSTVDSGATGSGSYYEPRHPSPVPLVKQEGVAQWQERGGLAADSPQGVWTLQPPQDDVISGVWRDADGSDPQPISLHRVNTPPTRRSGPGGEPRLYTACGNDAWLKPLLDRQQAGLERKQLFFDMPYRRRTLKLAAVSATLSTVELGFDTPQAKAINALLRKSFAEDLAFLNDCNRDSLERTGFGGAPSTEVRPVFLSLHLVVLRHARDAVGCVRPHDWRYATYDLTSGKRVDVNAWFAGEPVMSAGDDGRLGQLLRAACMKPETRKTLSDDTSCKGRYPNAHPGYRGMLFEAEGINHDTLEVDYGLLLPLLTPHGRAEAQLLIDRPGQGNSRYEF